MIIEKLINQICIWKQSKKKLKEQVRKKTKDQIIEMLHNRIRGRQWLARIILSEIEEILLTVYKPSKVISIISKFKKTPLEKKHGM